MAKARVLSSDVEMTVVPADSREQFLTQPSPTVHCMDDYKILMAGLSQVTTGYWAERNPSCQHLILYTHAGKAFVEIDGKTKNIRTGDVLLVPFGTVFSYGPESARWDISWFHLANTPDWNSLFPSELAIHQASWGHEVRTQMENYIKEVNTRRVDSQRLLQLLMEMMVLYLRRELGIDPPEFTEARQILQKLWEVVHSDLSHKWTADDMAHETHLSKSKLYRLCQKVHNTTPVSMITTMRMEGAAEMLSSTTYQLATIADSVGYEDAFTFSKAFKRYSGVSPKEYREKYNANL